MGWIGICEMTDHGTCGLVGANRSEAGVHAHRVSEEALGRRVAGTRLGAVVSQHSLDTSYGDVAFLLLQKLG